MKLLEGISIIIGVINLNFSCRYFFVLFYQPNIDFRLFEVQIIASNVKNSDWQVSVWSDKFAPSVSPNDGHPKKDFKNSAPTNMREPHIAITLSVS